MYNRKSYPELREDISPELHKECMKQYFLIQKLFQNIELNVGIDESGEALQKPKSRILRFLIGR